MTNTGFVIQARMTSTRLPGKVLLKVLEKPLLQYQIERLRRVTRIENIIIATTTNATDEPIIEFCEKEKLLFYRGSESDVLSRYYDAATQNSLSTIIRVTSDCPVIDPNTIDQLIDLFISEPNADYASNTLKRSFPRGFDAEIFSYEALSTANRFAQSTFEREHVTPYLYQNPQKFKLMNLLYEKDFSSLRLTVDTPEDFELVSRLIQELYPKHPEFGLVEIVDFFENHPQLMNINAHIEQKKT